MKEQYWSRIVVTTMAKEDILCLINIYNFCFPVALRVLEKCPLTLCGSELNVKPYLEYPMVKVSGVGASIPEEMLELFFESSKRSGGGDIRNIDLFTLTEAAIITFEESEGMFEI